MKHLVAATVAFSTVLAHPLAAQVRRQEAPQARPDVRRTLRLPRPPSALATEGDVPYSMPGRPLSTAGLKRLAGRRWAAMPDRRLPQPLTTGPLYDLPYLGDDLAPGERVLRGKKIHSSSGSQMWGYDLGAMKLQPNGLWSEVKPGTDWKDPENSDFYIYGQPVYAMGPGKVIRCWRNAPENPRPFSSALGDDFDEPFEERDWLHSAWRDLKMSGAGNHLLVEEDGGDLVLYAHAQPGTIPSSLCPHDATLYTTPGDDTQAEVPAAQQATLQAGQKLFVSGNSGNSSAPHLHVHRESPDGMPLLLRFHRGLSTPLAGSSANIDSWTRFAPDRIPDGPVLVWPPRRLAAEYARHGYPAGDYQRLFDHLADSGFWPEWLDGYSVGGQAFLNFVWRPAEGSWRSFFLLTGSDYQDRFDEAVDDGYAPVQVESSLVGGQRRYSVIFVKDLPGGWLARHGLTYKQHLEVLEEAKGLGLAPISISVTSVAGQRRYAVLYRAESLGVWLVRSRIPGGQYQELYDDNGDAGRRPSYCNAYLHSGSTHYTVVFSQQPSGPRKDRHGLTASGYQSEWESAVGSGLLTRCVSGTDGAQSQHRYIATWRQ